MRLTHTGDPGSLQLLVETLGNDGLEVEYDTAREPQRRADAATPVVLHVVDHAAGTVLHLAVGSAIAKVKSRFPGSETVILEDGHEDASDPPRGV